MENTNSQIVIYKDKNGNIKIDVRFDGDTVWLTQDAIATLYDKGRSTIAEHIQNIFQENELASNSVCREFRRTGIPISPGRWIRLTPRDFENFLRLFWIPL